MPELQRINIIAYTTAAEEGAVYDGPSFENIPLEEMKALYEEWEEEVQAITEVDLKGFAFCRKKYIIDKTLQSIPSVTRWAVQSLNPLNCFGKDNVLLLGDAAHAMTPHHGSGAGQAIEVKGINQTNQYAEPLSLGRLPSRTFDQESHRATCRGACCKHNPGVRHNPETHCQQSLDVFPRPWAALQIDAPPVLDHQHHHHNARRHLPQLWKIRHRQLGIRLDSVDRPRHRNCGKRA